MHGGHELVVAPWPGQGEVELHAQHRQGSAQLVTRLRDEPTLPAQGEVETVEHRVERPAELVDLVVGAGRSRSSELGAEMSSARRRIRSTGRSATPATT